MTEQESHEGVNRRHLFQTLAAGAAVSGVIGSPALAQQPPAAALEQIPLNPSCILRERRSLRNRQV